MDRNLDVFAKQYLQELMCQAEKERSLANLRRAKVVHHKMVRHTPHTGQPQLQDCTMSPSFSHNQS